MKYQDLKPKTDDELQTQLLELKKEQFNLRFQKASDQVANPQRIRHVRRDIARIKTLLTERRRQAAQPSA